MMFILNSTAEHYIATGEAENHTLTSKSVNSIKKITLQQ
jgi:hypothetical protein